MSERMRRCWHAALLLTFIATVWPPAYVAAQAEGRALEMVTPNGVNANVFTGLPASTPDGNYVCYHSEDSYLGAWGAGYVTGLNGYCARRTETGWKNSWETGPKPVNKDLSSGSGANIHRVSPDGKRLVFISATAIFGNEWEPEIGNPSSVPASTYLRESGVTRWVAPPGNPPKGENESQNENITADRRMMDASEDLRHGIFTSVEMLTPDDEPAPQNSSNVDVYEWTPDGLRLVTRNLQGVRVGGYTPRDRRHGGSALAVKGSVSRDGKRIFFEHRTGQMGLGEPAGVVSIFRREGEEVKLVSPRNGPGPAKDVYLAGASMDGDVAYLYSEQQLTDEPKDAGWALYRYEIHTDHMELVATHPDGIEPLSVSEDGSTVIYSTANGDPLLWVNRNGVEHLLGTANRSLDGGAQTSWGGVLSTKRERQGIRMTSDGRVVVFGSAGSFLGQPEGVTRIYKWEEGEGLELVSVDENGQPATADAYIGNYTHSNALNPVRADLVHLNMSFWPSGGRAISDDGNRIFFETEAGLVSADINGLRDVYEWHNGEISLVSPGTQEFHALYHDSSADGSTVFYTTRSRLIPYLDRDATPDLYAARIGGGFTYTLGAECEGDACQGDVATAPMPVQLGSAASTSTGRPSRVGKARFRLLKPRRKDVLRAAGRGILFLRLRTNDAGQLRVRAFARVGKRLRTVGSVRKHSARAGVTQLKLVLSRGARGELMRKGRLPLRIEVAFTQSDRKMSRRMVIRVRR